MILFLVRRKRRKEKKGRVLKNPIKKTNYIVCFKTLKKEKKKEGKTVQEPKLLLVPE